VLDVDVYFLPAYAVLALLAGLGADRLARTRAGFASATLSLALALALLPWNFALSDRSANRAVRRLGEDLLAAVDERGVLFVEGDTTIHALWYLQAVEQRAPGVIVFSAGHAWPWYLDQMAARYPDEPWPEHGDVADANHVRSVLARLIEERRCYHARSLDPQSLLGAVEGGPSYGTVPRGLAQEILRAGASLSVRELAEWNARYFEHAVEAFGAPLEHVDLDTKSVYLQYALSLFEAAQLFEAAGREDDARSAYAELLRFDPDRHERDVAADAWHGLRQRVPVLELGQRARNALERPSAAGTEER
jgi:tetratricopeptide (TPR) repeat protein